MCTVEVQAEEKAVVQSEESLKHSKYRNSFKLAHASLSTRLKQFLCLAFVYVCVCVCVGISVYTILSECKLKCSALYPR